MKHPSEANYFFKKYLFTKLGNSLQKTTSELLNIDSLSVALRMWTLDSPELASLHRIFQDLLKEKLNPVRSTEIHAHKLSPDEIATCLIKQILCSVIVVADGKSLSINKLLLWNSVNYVFYCPLVWDIACSFTCMLFSTNEKTCTNSSIKTVSLRDTYCM